MAGIYIHVPFCSRRCHYCDFYSSVNTSYTDDYIKSILVQIQLQSNYFHYLPKKEQVIETIYWGGGTPSLLSTSQIEQILQFLASTFKVSENAEITLEANPDDISLEYLQGLKAIGVNRLSLGIQSFDDTLLKLMNRRHSAKQAIQSVEFALKAGIDNFSIDLIYGLPGLNQKLWQETLDLAFSLAITHVSAYHLGIEEGTVFHHWLKKGKISEMPEDESWNQFEMLHEVAEQQGFEHYEISNLAKPGFRSQHNTSYWNDIPYLGLGPSAHSFNGIQRSWNVSGIKEYIEALAKNIPFSESENLTPENRLNEYIMTHLRTKEGLNYQYLKDNFGESVYIRITQYFERLKKTGMADSTKTHGYLTLKGWFVSDKIISELIE